MSAKSALAELMSTPDTARCLTKRAEDLAVTLYPSSDEECKQAYIAFRLGEKEIYGVPYRFVEEVMTVTKITKVPCTPPFIQGVINRRGDMLTVLDLRRLFHIETLGISPQQDILIIRVDNVTIGISVDELLGNTEYIEEKLSKPMPSGAGVDTNYVLGIDQGHITMLNFEAILSDETLQVNSSHL